MRIFNFLLFLIFCNKKSGGENNYYCYGKYFCSENPKDYQMHTMCKLEPCGYSGHCKDTANAKPLSDVERKEIVHWHNSFREFFAKSDFLAHISTKPFNLNDYKPMTVEYDDELEFIAQCWTNTCTPYEDPYCKTTTAFSSVEQNVFFSNRNDFLALWQPVGMWFSTIIAEKDNLTFITYPIKTSEARSFINVINPYTTNIGCGRTEWGRPERRVLLMVCNYGQAYNWNREPLWKSYNQYKAELGNKSLESFCSEEHNHDPTYLTLCRKSNFKISFFAADSPFQYTNDPYYWERKTEISGISADNELSYSSGIRGHVSIILFPLPFAIVITTMHKGRF